jgi:hypothetical protein
LRQRLFSLAEANELIPKLEMMMGRLQQCAAQLRSGITEAAALLGRPVTDLTTEEIIEAKAELGPVIEELERLTDEIEESGAQFKGLDLGLVDFPFEMNGEVVLLCWQYGEKEIGHWHSLEAGFAARQPLPNRGSPSRYLQ